MSTNSDIINGQAIRLYLLITSSIITLLLSALFSLKLGESPLQLTQLTDILLQQSDAKTRFIVLELRSPRLISAIMAGIALGLSGALMQTLTRNPLASPGIMGITPGVALGVVIGIVSFNLSQQGMLLIGMFSGFGCGFLVYLLNRKNRLQPLQLTLTGVSISLFATAAIMALLVTASAEANGLYFWLTGSLINRTWQHSWQLLSYIPIAALLALACCKPLDLMRLNDDQCAALGLNLTGWRLLCGICIVTLISVTVSVTGPIGFVGLAAPHIVRLALAQSFGALTHKWLLPLSALVGASLLCLADLLSIINQIPVGIVVACAGAPIFLYLIHEETRRHAY